MDYVHRFAPQDGQEEYEYKWEGLVLQYSNCCNLGPRFHTSQRRISKNCKDSPLG